MPNSKLFGALAAALLGAGALLFWATSEGQLGGEDAAYSAPGLDPMTPEAARDALFTLLPALLLQVYDAFGRVGEEEIYDTLAGVSAGDALEALYLERAGAMVDGGLTEADQTIHEMRLTKASAFQTGDSFRLDAQWEVIGTVGHSEHIHVRGNTYSAKLILAPVQGAWKITGFELTDVDRQTAGEFVEADGT